MPSTPRSSPSASPSAPSTSFSRKASVPRDPDRYRHPRRRGHAFRRAANARSRPRASRDAAAKGEEPSPRHRVGPWVPVTPLITGPSEPGGDRGGEAINPTRQRPNRGRERSSRGGEAINPTRQRPTRGRQRSSHGRGRSNRGRQRSSPGRGRYTRGRQRSTRGRQRTNRGRQRPSHGRGRSNRGRQRSSRGRQRSNRGRERSSRGGEAILSRLNALPRLF